MAQNRPESFTQKLQSYCVRNEIEQPRWLDYSDPRGNRTAWCSAVVVYNREYRANFWRDYRYLEQSREEAAEIAYKALTSSSPPPPPQQTQYSYGRGYSG
ncbi:hypothetical protein P154DRAFT_580257 [Amniculicola lignicola CBS 123094]|uniref:DRBM domain-containing protein n=1 Tax=Amniculicola lignicola CBS 123094 TaxID=1392246 RepID=A0A6A5WED6_9PLEO|nr:hypothetical protein P154DRAFT_580257 [Amniculicola lignicola CBS 123094]